MSPRTVRTKSHIDGAPDLVPIFFIFLELYLGVDEFVLLSSPRAILVDVYWTNSTASLPVVG